MLASQNNFLHETSTTRAPPLLLLLHLASVAIVLDNSSVTPANQFNLIVRGHCILLLYLSHLKRSVHLTHFAASTLNSSYNFTICMCNTIYSPFSLPAAVLSSLVIFSLLSSSFYSSSLIYSKTCIAHLKLVSSH